MAIKCNICNKELDAFSGGRCKICRALVCTDCIASGGTDKKVGIICKNCQTKKKATTTQNSNKKETTDTEATQDTPTPGKGRIILLILISFTILSIFIYTLTIPYISTKNALQIVEFGPQEKFNAAKTELAGLSGTFIIDQLEEMAKTGRKDTAIRATYALGAQPDPRAVLALKKLQASDDCPDFLKSVIVEALLENERLYNSEPDETE